MVFYVFVRFFMRFFEKILYCPEKQYGNLSERYLSGRPQRCTPVGNGEVCFHGTPYTLFSPVGAATVRLFSHILCENPV